MKYFFDTEFYVTEGHPVQIFPISLGIVSEDGRTLYVEFEGASEFARGTDWLDKNVSPHLSGKELPIDKIERLIREFIGNEKCDFLAKYGAYDWVLLCQIFGSLMAIPENWPWYYTETVLLNLPEVEPEGAVHNALGDALTLRKSYQHKFLSITE
jgi:hypothetical protein